ncbi:MAG TPA: UPF0182 family protein [Acidobacteriaceae bacterium]|nr:UPF0182 family protein [Acidobacteriaceae bacterium]
MHQTIDIRRRSRRPNRLLLFIAAVVLLVLLGGNTALSWYVDSLWFGSLGYSGVFWKTLRLNWSAFGVFSVATFLILYGWFLLLWKLHQADLPQDRAFYIGRQQLNIPMRTGLRFLGLLASLGIAVITGTAMMAEWPTFALWWSTPRAAHPAMDPVFGRPLDFYLFALPAWQLIAGWLTTLAVIACLAALGFIGLAVSGKALHADTRFRFAVPWRGLSIAFAFFLLMLAVQTWLARFGMLLDAHTIFSGVSYTEAHITITGLLIVAAMLIVGALIAASNALGASAGGSRLVLAVLPAILCYLGVHAVAWYVSSFIVRPNQLNRERPYIAWNIDATRRAWALDAVARSEFPAEITPEAAKPAENQATLQNVRLWDWRALQDTLRQIQEIRTYYDFPDIDIDRYSLNGQTREVMLASRELNVDKLPESSRNWINEKLIYTHGYGITMNPVNGFTQEGLPNLILSNMPVESTDPGIVVRRPEIYFGEMTNTDVYVKTRQAEFNYPQGQNNNLSAYEGSGGIALGGLMRRILLAADRGDLSKLPFSDDVSPESRLLMRRNVYTRVRTIAPFLTWDPDPYIVLGDDGHLYWILDAYTTSSMYPESTSYGLGEDSINYMRNSVKAVVDAYNGTTTMYVFDAQDPVLAAWRNVFPELFRDAATMPADLHRHVRYPQLLLEEQATVYALYHMNDPEVFYNREDLWTVASELTLGEGGEQETHTMAPNYVLMKLPGASSVEFVAILPFTPANRNNLIGWIAGRSDGEHYGTAAVYDFPKTRLVDGPLQVEARIDQNAQLSGQLTLWNQQGSHVRRGTLLVIPCGRALLYAEPIYLQAAHSPMPELRLVVLALQDRLAYATTYEAALQSLFGGQPSSLTSAPGQAAPEAAPSQPNGAKASVRQDLIRSAAKDLSDYQQLTAQGKLAEAGQKLQDLKRKLDELQQNQH